MSHCTGCPPLCYREWPIFRVFSFAHASQEFDGIFSHGDVECLDHPF